MNRDGLNVENIILRLVF